MSKIADNVLQKAGYLPEQVPAIRALVALAAARAMIHPRDYFADPRDIEGKRAHRTDCREVAEQWSRVKAAVLECRIDGVEDGLVIAESKSAFSGRCTWDGKVWEYCPGQNYPTEYRQAVAVVLEAAASAARRARPPVAGEIKTMDDLINLNRHNGGHWFDQDTMRFFGTRIESGILKGRYFITSEQPPDGPRAFSVRSFDEFGSVDTVGEFPGYATRAEAMQAVP